LHHIPVDLPEQRIIEPRWSPDGMWIAFLSGETPSALRIYRIRPDGRDLQQLTDSAGNMSGLQWSPNGKWLLFTESHQHGTDIKRTRADGSSVEYLTSGQGNNYSPQYVSVSDRNFGVLGLFIAVSGIWLSPL
jgi:Tol biopolymer transport system component